MTIVLRSSRVLVCGPLLFAFGCVSWTPQSNEVDVVVAETMTEDATGSEQPSALPTPVPAEAPVQTDTPTPQSLDVPTAAEDESLDDAGTDLPFQLALSLCPKMSVSNAPAADSDDVILGYKMLVTPVDGLVIATAPVETGCLSSSFGPRNGGVHKGIDLHAKGDSTVYAAGHGTVLEATYRSDYGNMIVIDHGEGVYTRYAHLQRFVDGVREGQVVQMGDVLGPMGSTAGYTIPQHLHYELLTGDYDTPKKSFGLTPMDIFALEAAE